MIDDSGKCPLWGILVENTDITAGPLGLPGPWTHWAFVHLAGSKSGYGNQLAAAPRPCRPAQRLGREGKADAAQLPQPQRKPDHSERQMREPSALSTVFPKSQELSLVAWGRAKPPVDEAGCPLWVRMRNVVQTSSSFMVAPHGRTFYLGKFQSSAFVRSSLENLFVRYLPPTEKMGHTSDSLASGQLRAGSVVGRTRG